MTTKEYTYTILPDGRVKIVNSRNQVTILKRASIEIALTSGLLTPEFEQKYRGALAALDEAEKRVKA